MSLDVAEALRAGYDRTIARNGLMLAAIIFVIQVINTVSNASVTQASGLQGLGTTSPLALGGPDVLWWGLMGLAALANMWVAIAGLRLFSSDNKETLPKDVFTENIGPTLLNYVVGGLIYGLIVVVGLVLLVIPGIFFAVSLIFWQVLVAVEERNFIEALKEAWDLARGNRIELFLLGLAVLLIGFAIGFVFAIPGVMVGAAVQGVGQILVNLGSSLVTVFGLAALVNAYQQVAE